jgi:uncharacterized protein YecA (UPF0149 family)
MMDDSFQRESVYERLIPLYERLGMQPEKKDIEEMQRRDGAEETDRTPEAEEMEAEPDAVSVNRPKPFGKVGRNAPCPCGSGKKYKKCCLEKR